jgi:hypothetical protein
MLAAVKTPQNYMTKVGNYTTSGSTADMTPIITNYSSEADKKKRDAVKAAYSILQPGDSLLYDYGDKGHAVLVTAINTSTKRVYYIEQIGSGKY